MRAFVTIPVEEKTIAKKGSAAYGLVLPYLSKNGLPLFTLDSENSPFVTADYVQVDAFPGMVGVTVTGQVFTVDKEEEAQLLPIRVITQKEYERFVHLTESFKQEAKA